MRRTTVNETQNVATMTAAELESFIQETEKQHKQYMNALRALMRVRQAEEGEESE